jgi:chalcone isomerase-like protein
MILLIAFLFATFADQIQIDGQTLVLNGVGLRQKTIFSVDVYQAALYLTARSRDERAILGSRDLKVLDVVFLRNVSVKDLVKSWDEGFAMNCTENCQVFDKRLSDLKGSMAAVKKGQKVRFIFNTAGLKIATEGRVESHAGKDFADMVLANFIGVPPSAKLKDGLLGRTFRH